MFWTDWGTVPKIERSNLAGEKRVVLINTNLKKPLGMSVDVDNDHLYWVDDYWDRIERSDFNGNNRISFQVKKSPSPGRIIVDRSTLFGIAVYQVSTKRIG